MSFPRWGIRQPPNKDLYWLISKGNALKAKAPNQLILSGSKLQNFWIEGLSDFAGFKWKTSGAKISASNECLKRPQEMTKFVARIALIEKNYKNAKNLCKQNFLESKTHKTY